MKQHLIIVLNSAYQNKETGQTDYQRMVIDDSVLNFLNNFANVEKAPNMQKIFVVNNMRLQYLGVVSDDEAKAKDIEVKDEEVVDGKDDESIHATEEVPIAVIEKAAQKKRPARRIAGGTGPR